MIYVVLGLGFSGTTLVSELMHHAGVRMIDDEVDDYDRGDKYESRAFFTINRELLELTDDQAFHLRPRDCPARITQTQKKQMAKLIDQQQARYDHWGFKDPRTVVTYPLWRNVIPPHRLVAVFRSPESNWPRHKWRGMRRRYTNVRRAYVHLRQWCEYNAAILDFGHDLAEDFLLLSYEDLMRDDLEVDRLSSFLGAKLEDRRKDNLYRSRFGDDLLFRTVRCGMSLFSKYSPAMIQRRLKIVHLTQREQYSNLLGIEAVSVASKTGYLKGRLGLKRTK